eukprot:351486-Chlamydomonas_euryale.AAC.11
MATARPCKAGALPCNTRPQHVGGWIRAAALSPARPSAPACALPPALAAPTARRAVTTAGAASASSASLALALLSAPAATADQPLAAAWYACARRRRAAARAASGVHTCIHVRAQCLGLSHGVISFVRCRDRISMKSHLCWQHLCQPRGNEHVRTAAQSGEPRPTIVRTIVALQHVQLWAAERKKGGMEQQKGGAGKEEKKQGREGGRKRGRGEGRERESSRAFIDASIGLSHLSAIAVSAWSAWHILRIESVPSVLALQRHNSAPS